MKKQDQSNLEQQDLISAQKEKIEILNQEINSQSKKLED